MQLRRAASVLTCLAIAAMYDEEIDATDVAQVTRELIDEVIDALDSLNVIRAIRDSGAQLSDGPDECD